MDNELFDIIIIGGGPAGMFAQYYAGLRELKTALIEATPRFGGQVSALYSEKKILDLPTFINITGRDLIDKLAKQSQLVDSKSFFNSQVTDIQKKDDLFEIEINHHAYLRSKSVIVATGSGSFSPRRVSVPGSDNAEQGGRLRYLLPDFKNCREKSFAVVGGGNTAVDYANELIDHGKKVSLIHRRENFRALESSVSKLENSELVSFYLPKRIASLDQQSDGISIELEDLKDQNIEKIKVDQLIGGYGFTASSAIIDAWSLSAKKYRYRFATDSKQMSSVPGLFVIGDASAYPGKADLIATGFGEAPTAINSAVEYFDPDRGGPQHSTSLDPKKVFTDD